MTRIFTRDWRRRGLIPLLKRRQSETVFPKRVLYCDLPVSKGEKIATVDFDASAIGFRPRERPLGNPSVPGDKMACVIPAGVRKRRPDLRKASSHGFAARVPSAAYVRSCRRFENTVV